MTGLLKRKSIQALLGVPVLACLLFLAFFAAPLSYPKGAFITIPEGTTVREAGEILKEKHALRSVTAFSLLVRLEKNGVIAGVYLLKDRETAFSLASRFSRGITGISQVKVTIPEGATTDEMGTIFSASLGIFDSAKFRTLARSEEGYLFPDTYFLLPNASPESVISLMRQTFDEKTAPLKPDLEAFGRPESDIITMASILEKEARQSETRRMVAGILWKRIALAMPLQVDAAFSYILGKSGYAPTLDDLKIDSPYNTYLHKGLPPGPIGNPGVEAIEDAMHPTKNPYLYYLTDKEGNIYYAKTFAEHVANKAKVRN